MSEEVRPFEEYKEMIKNMRKEEMIKGLYDLSKNINEKSKEIERLHSIIKEVREWILYQQGHNITTLVSIDELDELLEILDKENKE